jgi:hypothetical protein
MMRLQRWNLRESIIRANLDTHVKMILSCAVQRIRNAAS